MSSPRYGSARIRIYIIKVSNIRETKDTCMNVLISLLIKVIEL